jgi:small ligand-binding sensory domain FIST
LENANNMRWASAVSGRVDSRTAAKEALRALMVDCTVPPDLLFAFVSHHHAAAYDELTDWLHEQLPSSLVLGCSAAGVIGAGSELEGREAISLTGGWLPDTRVSAQHIQGPALEMTRVDWLERLHLAPDEPCQFLLLVDPNTYDVEHLLGNLDRAFPAACKVGGLVSGAANDKPTAFFAGGRVHRGGALIVSFQGATELRAVISQGCRPVGEPFIVTRSNGNVIKEFNTGKPAEVLRKVYDAMNARDHALFNTSLFLGIGLGENRSRYESGDFLIRNILGVDPESGAMAVDTRIEAYQVVQFHLRDRDTAAADLAQRLRELARSDAAPRVRGALLFSGSGRGERLFGVANHDSDAFARRVGPVSLSGLFCAGEIGPVGGKTCVHGYTSLFAVFCSRL